MTAITTSLKELLGETDGDNDDFESWLDHYDDCSPGIMAALECGLDDELVIEATQQQPATAPFTFTQQSTAGRVLCPLFARPQDALSDS